MNKYNNKPYETRRKGKNKSRFKYGGDGPSLTEYRNLKNRDFECKHCHNLVISAPAIAGVKNRNHCPYCLWSKHVDLHKPGDRLAACKEEMRPVGLTLKSTRDKYAKAETGELMLIHQCVACDSVSINRIAADDDVKQILAVFEDSLDMDSPLKALLQNCGIRILKSKDFEVVQIRLLGYS